MEKHNVSARKGICLLAEEMEYKLSYYDSIKGVDGWKNLNAFALMSRVDDEVDELRAALVERYHGNGGTQSSKAVKAELADVANFCMMILEVINRDDLEEKEMECLSHQK